MLRLRDLTLTMADYYWLGELKRSRRSASSQMFFADAPVLMGLRRNTAESEEENCEVHNHKRILALANEQKVPVLSFPALHEGVSQEVGVKVDERKFRGLAAHLELAVGAPVLLIHNLAVEHGLINGSQGTVLDIVFAPGHSPNHESVECRVPEFVLVDFPEYRGPGFFQEPERRTWIPILPVISTSEDDDDVTRIQFPLTLAFALTPWKAQGMTLSKVIVRLGAAGTKPGVLFVAMTRVRHPDHLMLEDDFPSYSALIKQLANPAFAARIF